MADKINADRRSANMRAIKSANTKPELIVRKLAHRMGLRFRLHQRGLPGKPDLVFRKHRTVILVHGCFWHGHRCTHGGKGPKSNQEYWLPKIRTNRDRDRRNLKNLRDEGWRVLTIWECETKDASGLVNVLKAHFGSPPTPVTKKPRGKE